MVIAEMTHIHSVWLMLKITHRYCYHNISWMTWTVSIKLTGDIH